MSISYLNEDPDTIFDKVDILGEGSYGTVYKALNKKDGNIYAIKIVPVENDIAEVEKEINILKQCNSDYIVKYYGAYKKENDLWIVIEYCGGGSVSDILNVLEIPLTEAQIACVCQNSLQGLDYLHSQKKIHRDIKAGNILVNEQADFGVSAQLNNTISKKQTVIGTPYWMAPEVIQETSYNWKADIWSLGITAIEMCQMKPPLAGIHPMRAIFMIPNRPAPTLDGNYSSEFKDFVSQCLAKEASERPSAKKLLKHPFIRKAKSNKMLIQLVDQMLQKFMKYGGRAQYYKEIEKKREAEESDGDTGSDYTESDDSDDDSDDGQGTMIANNRTKVVQDTMVKKKKGASNDDSDEDSDSDDDNSDDDSDDDATMIKTDFKKYKDKHEKGQNKGDGVSDALVETYDKLSVQELQNVLGNLDQELEKQIQELKETFDNRKKAIMRVLKNKK